MKTSWLALVLALGACPHVEPRQGLIPATREADLLVTTTLPDAVVAARATLLNFRQRGEQAAQAALRVITDFEPPERYEERGKVGDQAYYYIKDTYKKVGITIHHDGRTISNVEAQTQDSR